MAVADVRIPCWWEEGIWPVIGGEIDSAHFEDIRKRTHLLESPDLGFIDIEKRYGREIATDPVTYVPYDHINWAGSWSAFEAPSIAHPGDIVVLFKGQDGVEDLYVNYVEMGESVLDRCSPLGADGMLDSRWRLSPSPNLYHHFDHNAGRPGIGADGRYIVIFHPADVEKNFLEYVWKGKAHLWLARQVDPYRQIPPVKYPRGPLPRHQSVELLKDNLSKDIGTSHARTLDTVGYEEDVKPRRLGEYILSGGEPDCGGCMEPDSACQLSNQCACDLKFSTAYQARVIKVAEGCLRYLKEVDAQWIENWTWAQEKLLWEDATYYTKDTIVYLVTEEDETLYVCLDTHTSNTANDKPGSGTNWEDKWTTPAYNPSRRETQSVYDHLASGINAYPASSFTWLWGCNDSAFELLLRDIGGAESVYPAWDVDHGDYFEGDVVQYGDVCKQCKQGHESSGANNPDNTEYWAGLTQFDWWWDVSYPAVPYWLYKHQFQEDVADWPLPRGCWRRTWKHSAGRLGTLMWPGEKGDPPGYVPLQLIVSQAVYNGVPEANQKWYAVSDVETLHAAAYGAEEEALIAKRHDPVETRHIQYYDEKAGHDKWAHHPLYELHHDLANDLRNVLLQLHLIDADELGWQVWECEFNSLGTIECGSSAGEYKALRTSALQTRPQTNGLGPPEANPWYVGISQARAYGYYVNVSAHLDADFSGVAYRRQWCVSVRRLAGVDAVRTFPIASVLTRVLYFGQAQQVPPPENEAADGCVIGYEDITIYAALNDATQRYKYVRLKLNPISPIEDGGFWWWDFDSYIESPWPATGRGQFFDWVEDGPETRKWYRQTQVDPRKEAIEDWCVFDMDWNKIPEGVFDEDENIAIVVD